MLKKVFKPKVNNKIPKKKKKKKKKKKRKKKNTDVCDDIYIECKS